MQFTAPFLRVSVVGGLALLLGLPGIRAAAQPPAAKVSTVTYDVGEIVAKRKSWDPNPPQILKWSGAAWPEPALETLARTVLDLLTEARPKLAGKFLGKDAPYRIQLLNGKQLAVRADGQTQAEVKDLLGAIQRSLDLAVIVDCGLFEVDRQVYEKKIAPKLSRRPGEPPVFAAPATDEEERKFLEGKGGTEKPFYEGMKALRTARVILPNRVPGQIFSWRTTLYYEKPPARAFVKAERATAFPGFSFTVTPVVSGDRRAVRLRLTQAVTRLLQWDKVKAVQFLTKDKEKEIAFEVPVLQESSFTSDFTLFDGATAVVPVQWGRPGAEGRRLLLVFTARILIEEEERQIRKALQDEKKK